MINRRQLLKSGASALVLSSSLVKTQTLMAQMAHSHHVMSHHNRHGDTSALMELERMPAGRPLAPLPTLRNRSKDSQLFKATLIAEPTTLTVAGRKPTEFWLYNGELPGPQIELYEGDEVEILFKNRLPEPTTIHWHGLPVPPDQDGNPQDAVLPDEDRYYRFTLPEGSAGTYWYHPHPHGKTAMQVARGLAGTLIVRAKNDPLAHLPEQHWMISDLRLDTEAVIPNNTMLDWMNGREGQFVLINGQRNPTIKLNAQTRVRIWNNCSARYLHLSITDCQWMLLGTDGGLLEAPQGPFNELFLAPAERVEVLLIPSKKTTAPLINQYYNREKMMVDEPAVDMELASVVITDTQRAVVPDQLRQIPPLGEPVATKVVEFSEMHMDHHAMDTMSHETMQEMFLINGKSYEMERIDLESKLGEVELWRVFNNSHMDHPFHLHGTQFQVIQREQNSVVTPEPFLAWRDTVNLRPYETISFLVQQNHPGLRMFHCHILEHEDLGMMANLKIVK